MKLDVRIVIPGLALQMPDPLAVGLGGSETAGLQLAAAMNRIGHRVIVFANVPAPSAWRGIMFLPLDAYTSMMGTLACDLLIVQRNPRFFALRQHAKATMLWVHDLMAARRSAELMGSIHAIDRIVTVSRFQRDQWLQVTGDLTADDYLVARNGIDLELIDEAIAGVPRHADRLVYTSRPERGLEPLLAGIFPRILAARPNAELHIAAYDCPNPGIEPYYQYLKNLARPFGRHVVWHGALAKRELYQLVASAAAQLYPTPAPIDPSFNETSCIAAMEAMACRTPWISTNRGALSETVGEAGLLVPMFEAAHAGDQGVIERMTGATLAVLDDTDMALTLAARGRARAEVYDWREVAEQLADDAVAIMRKASSSRFRLARHFYQRQGIEAAFKVVEAYEQDRRYRFEQFQPDPLLERFADALRAEYAHATSTDDLSQLYDQKVGPNNAHVAEMLSNAPASRFKEQPFVRYARLRDLIVERLPAAREGKPLRILDWGCSQGECAIVLANSFPGSTVVGIDASSDEVARAQALAAKFADTPERISFFQADENAPLPPEVASKWFDVIVMSEVLEHVHDPRNVIETLEANAYHGGAIMVISVPFGPWETQQPKTHPRQHIREFEVADLEDMLGAKPGLMIDQAADQFCPVTGLPLGNTYATYAADGKPLGEIDWERKLTLQRPRETLSVCMMIGGRESAANLHWCLSSVAAIADEIVIADCDMGDEARRIAAQYGAVTFPHASPLQTGFETPRNAALDRCVGDWILMLDADERLISPATMWRYLRSSPIHTFAIRQHHFAVDAAWPPDMPGRLFRREPERKTGKPMRFWGMLHEHAELGVNEGCGASILLPDVAIAHVGYVDNGRRGERYARNLPLLHLDVATYPDRKLARMIVMRDSMIRAKFVVAGAGRNPAEPGCAAGLDEPTQLCRDVIGTWAEFFADDEGAMSGQAAEFYHDACRCLGTDIVADVVISILRDGIGGASPNALFFASVDHVERRARSRLKAATAMVTHEHW